MNHPNLSIKIRHTKQTEYSKTLNSEELKNLIAEAIDSAIAKYGYKVELYGTSNAMLAYQMGKIRHL